MCSTFFFSVVAKTPDNALRVRGRRKGRVKGWLAGRTEGPRDRQTGSPWGRKFLPLRQRKWLKQYGSGGKSSGGVLAHQQHCECVVQCTVVVAAAAIAVVAAVVVAAAGVPILSVALATVALRRFRNWTLSCYCSSAVAVAASAAVVAAVAAAALRVISEATNRGS